MIAIIGIRVPLEFLADHAEHFIPKLAARFFVLGSYRLNKS